MDETFLLALMVTMGVETGVLIAGARWFCPDPPPLTRLLFAGIFASSWTLPYLWFLIPRFISGWALVPLGESLVTLAESLLLWVVLGLRYRLCLLLSVACNGTSAVVGLGLWKML